jgi:hypothetical protein
VQKWIIQQSLRGGPLTNLGPFLTTLFVTTLLFTMAVVASSVGEDFPIIEKALEKNVTINPEGPLKLNINNVASQVGVPFCVEGSSDVEALLDKTDLFNTIQTDAASFIARLEALGFSVQKYTNGVLLRSPEVVRIVQNPMDKTVPEFHFEGQYEAFLKKILSLFPRPGPGVFSAAGQFSNISCRIDVSKSISLRDLLMLSSEQSGIKWKVVILPEAPTIELHDNTGKLVGTTRGNRVRISFLLGF